MSVSDDCSTYDSTFQAVASEPFVSQVTQPDPPTSHSIEIMKEELERYLQRLVTALAADLATLRCAVDSLQDQIDGFHP